MITYRKTLYEIILLTQLGEIHATLESEYSLFYEVDPGIWNYCLPDELEGVDGLGDLLQDILSTLSDSDLLKDKIQLTEDQEKELSLVVDEALYSREIFPSSPKNLREAVMKVAWETGRHAKNLVKDGIVTEYESENDKSEFTTWYFNGEEVPPGTPIGYTVRENGVETNIFPYAGMEEKDEDAE